MTGLQTEVAPSWADIDAELSKGEQMGHQTVMQFAKVGQMLAARMGTMSLREFVPCVGQHIPRLSRSTIHRYLTLAQHLPLLEKAQPDSQNEALRLIAATKVPARGVPAPAPAPAQQTPRGAPAAPDAFVKWDNLMAHIADGRMVSEALNWERICRDDPEYEDDAEFYEKLSRQTGLSEGELEFRYSIYLEFSAVT